MSLTKNHSHLQRLLAPVLLLSVAACVTAPTRPAPAARSAAEWYAAAGAATRAYDFAACADAATHSASVARAARDDGAWLSAALLAAKCAEAGGDLPRARAWLDDATQRQPAAVDAWRARAALEERAGDWAAAELAWGQVALFAPLATGVRLNLARTAAAQGRGLEAAECALGYLAGDLRTAQAVAAAERVTAALATWPGARAGDYAASLRDLLAARGTVKQRTVPAACIAPWQALLAAGHGEAFAQGVARLAGSAVAESWWAAHAPEVAALEQAMAAAAQGLPRG
jgi:hypothetical protein